MATTLNSVSIGFVPDTTKLSDINVGFRTKSGIVPILHSTQVGWRTKDELGNAELQNLSLGFRAQDIGTLLTAGLTAQLSHERLLSQFDDINVIRDSTYAPDTAIIIAGFREESANTVTISVNGVDQESFDVDQDLRMYVKSVSLSGDIAVISISGDCYISDCTLILR